MMISSMLTWTFVTPYRLQHNKTTIQLMYNFITVVIHSSFSSYTLLSLSEYWVASQHTTQFAVAATNHITLSSDEMTNEVTLDEVK